MRLILLAFLGFAALAFPSTYASLPTYQAAVSSEPALVSYYKFDQGDANDAKGSNQGTAIDTVTYSQGVGSATDKALVLKANGHIDLGEVADFDFSSGAGTVEAWVRADWTTIAYNPTIFADRDGGSVNWSIHMNSGKDAIGLWNGSEYLPQFFPVRAGTNWHHLAVVFGINSETSENTFTVYWDGTLIGSTTQGLGTSPESPTEIGSSSLAGAERWNGAIDEVAFYNDSLSGGTIKAHYDAFLLGEPPAILTQPIGGTFLAGIPLHLSVESKGTDLSYQWSRDGSPIIGATNDILTLPSLSHGDAGSYTVVVSNPAGQVTSTGAVIALGSKPAKLQHYQDIVRAEGSLISLYTFDTVNASDSKNTNNGTLQGKVRFDSGVGGAADKAAVLDGASHINLGTVDAFDFASGLGTVEAWVRADWTNAPGYNPAIFADRDGGSVNWSMHLNQGKDAAGLWNGSTYEPQPTPGTGTSWHHLAIVFDNSSGSPAVSVYWDGHLSGTTSQSLGGNPEAPTEIGSSSVSGAERWIGAIDEVAFYSDALPAASILAHYSAFVQGDAPVITAQPESGSFFSGSTVNLSVGAQGLDLQYQWLFNGVQITGATASTYSIIDLDSSKVGNYAATVTNSSGTVQSSNAVIALITPNLPAYRTEVLAETNLISLYTFDSGDATDAKGSNNGSAVDLPAFGPGVGGATDQALVLDGNGHIDLGEVTAFDFSSGQGSIEAWIRPDWTENPGYNPTLFADRDGGPVNWSIHMNSGKEAAGLWNGSAYSPLPISNAGTYWHYLVAVFGASDSGATTFTLYWDGRVAGTTPQGLGPNPESPTELGSAGLFAQERWIGALDEVAFYSSSLSADAVLRHYQAFTGTSAVGSPRLEIISTGGQLTISWPADTSGFVLESTSAIPGTAWTAVPGVTGTSVTINPTDKAAFYRLRKP